MRKLLISVIILCMTIVIGCSNTNVVEKESDYLKDKYKKEFKQLESEENNDLIYTDIENNIVNVSIVEGELRDNYHASLYDRDITTDLSELLNEDEDILVIVDTHNTLTNKESVYDNYVEYMEHVQYMNIEIHVPKSKSTGIDEKIHEYGKEKSHIFIGVYINVYEDSIFEELLVNGELDSSKAELKYNFYMHGGKISLNPIDFKDEF